MCTYCSRDFNEAKAPLIHGIPTCNDCYQKLYRRPFPTWLTIAALLAIAFVIFGFWYNRNYFIAYSKVKFAAADFRRGDLTNAAVSARTAANLFPNEQSVGILADFYDGYLQFVNGNSAQAIPYFERCLKIDPSATFAKFLLAQAYVGKAFDESNYSLMYASAQGITNMAPVNVNSLLTLASSAACLYADGRGNRYAMEANGLIEQAQRIGATNSDVYADLYVQRIKYRLATKKIISPDEYTRLFPESTNRGKQ